MDNATLQTEITITSDVDKEEYIFRIPSIGDQVRIGMKCRDIRRKYDPSTNGSIYGLDGATHELVMAFATFECQLRAGPAWVYGNATPGPDTSPKVDYENFPPRKEAAMLDVFRKYDAEVMRFRDERIGPDAANP